MTDEILPDLSPAALGRLVAGMTPEQAEAVIGRYHRPNLHQGRPYYAWIGEGAMLRAFFRGSGGTLSGAVLDVSEEQRVLDLSGNRRQRMRRCTITQTWNCIPCRRQHRQSQSGRAVICPMCDSQCEQVVPGIRIPSPRRVRAWDEFWEQYRAEKLLLDAYAKGEVKEAVKLKLLNVELPKRRRTR